MRSRRAITWAVAIAFLAPLLVLAAPTSPAGAAPGPEPLITFYVPLHEDDYMEALRSIDTAQATPRPGTVARTTISLVAASAGAVIYYDQWENGYEADINDPAQTAGAGRTVVWGDGDTTNGDVSPFCPRCTGDTIPAGGVITLNNSRLPDGTGTPSQLLPGPVPTPRNSANVFWDGRDKIASTRGLAVSDIAWGQADALASGAVSVLDTNRWGLQYVVPVGQDTPNPTGGTAANSPTEYTALSVMAGSDDTHILIDVNADGDYTDAVDVDVVRGEGQTVFVDGGILEGAHVLADKPVQADMFVGDNNASYEVSFVELVPLSGFNTDYFAPAATYTANQETVVYLYNPGATPLAVTRQTSSGSTIVNVPAQGSAFTILDSPLGGAARLTAPAPFLAAGIVGAVSGDGGASNDSAAYDWGYAPVPTNYLTPSIVIGWAPGSQDLTDFDGSPVWVTSAQATDVYVDYDGDPTTGASTLPNTGVCSSTDRYDTIISIPALSSVRIHDAVDGQMDGARITTCDLNLRISAAYGEDPSAVTTGFPGLDLGTAQFPAPSLLTGKASSLVVDVNGDGTVDPGDTVEWTVTLADASTTALTNTVVTDDLPAGLSYVSGTTTRDTGSGPVAIPDDGVPPNATAFPLDESGTNIGNIAPGGVVTLTYRTVVDDPPPANTVVIDNIVCAQSDQAAECGSGSTQLDPLAVISDRVWADTDADGIQDAGETGGVAGVTVNLYLDADGNGVPDGPAIATTTTDGSGLYRFTVDPTPNYVVEFVRPTGSSFTTRDVGANEAVDSDADPTTGRTGSINPAPGQVVTEVDAGIVPAATISDRVWEDTDGDGIQDTGEPGLPGVTVELYLDADGNGVPDGPAIRTATTDASGLYAFADLNPNVNYVVGFVSPGGRAASPANVGANDAVDSDASVATGRTGTINPAPGEVITHVDAGFLPPSITITKVSDASADGDPTVGPGDDLTYTITVGNPGPGNLTGIAVTDTLPPGLSWVSTTVTRPITTVAQFWADGFQSNTYAGSATGSATWASSWVESGDNSSSASGDIRLDTDLGDISAHFEQADANDALTRTFGNVAAASRVRLTYAYRCDSMESGDAIAAQVRPNGTASWRTLATYNDCDHATYQSATFDLLATDIGTATQLRFLVTDSFNSTFDDFYVDDIRLERSNRTTSTVAGSAPATLTTLPDLLPGESATITVVTTVDDPLATSITSFHNTAVADPDEVPPVDDDVEDPAEPAVISDLLFNDWDADGVQDAGETGVDGATVELYDATGTTLLQSTTTAGGGLYSFTVAPGSYQVRFVAPGGRAFTLQDQGADDALDSDADPTTGRTGTISVSSGQTRTDVDAGLLATGSIGDTIFEDVDDDGLPGAGEGLGGVDVTVVWAGPDGSLATAGDNVSYTTTTAGDGTYLVDELPPGTYSVTVDTADLPPALTISSVDPDGGADSTSQLTLGLGEANLDQDFGYRRPNSPPSLGADLVARCANGQSTVAVLGNDGDLDGDTVTITSVTPTSAAGGTVTLNSGVVSYRPPINFSGVDVFRYTADDGYGGTSTTTVTVVLSGDCLIGNDRMYTFGLGGTAGPGPGPGQYDQITSTRAIDLQSQQLVIRLRDGFLPSPGDTFDIWVAPSMSGSFAKVYGQVTPDGTVLEVQVLPDRVRLVARQGLIVTTADDAVDAAPGDGSCLTAGGDCSLRAAVQESNALPGTQAIVALGRSTMALGIAGAGEDASATGDLDVTADVVVVGQDGTVDAAGLDRAVHVGSGAVLRGDRFVVTGGDAGAGAGGGLLVAGGTADLRWVRAQSNAAATGGGIALQGGSATLVEVYANQNTATDGGGIAVLGGNATLLRTQTRENGATATGGGLLVDAGGIATLRTFVSFFNQAPDGAGVDVRPGATATLDGSVLWFNLATGTGGSIRSAGALTVVDSRILFSRALRGSALAVTGGTATVERSTFDTNVADDRGTIDNAGTLQLSTSTLSGNTAGEAGGVHQTAGTATLSSVTVTNNTMGTAAGVALLHAGGSPLTLFNTIVADQAVGVSCAAPPGGILSLGYNHTSDASCALAGTGDVQTGSALLGPLASNGGLGPSHRPQVGSPVINTGAPSCGPRDQRNFPRPRGGACEKGAIEL